MRFSVFNQYFYLHKRHPGWVAGVCYAGFFFQAEDGIRDAQESRGLGDVYKRQCQISVMQVKVRFSVFNHYFYLHNRHPGWVAGVCYAGKNAVFFA